MCAKYSLGPGSSYTPTVLEVGTQDDCPVARKRVLWLGRSSSGVCLRISCFSYPSCHSRTPGQRMWSKPGWRACREGAGHCVDILVSVLNGHSTNQHCQDPSINATSEWTETAQPWAGPGSPSPPFKALPPSQVAQGALSSGLPVSVLWTLLPSCPP